MGIFPDGASPYGVLDMSGNVWEWCRNKYANAEDDQIDDSGDPRVVRGGSWSNDQNYARAAYRFDGDPGLRSVDTVFGWWCVVPHLNKITERCSWRASGSGAPPPAPEVRDRYVL